MRTKHIFMGKFIAIAMLVGVLSPSISIESKIDLDKDILTNLTSSDISISLFSEAQARRGRGMARRSGRRAGRRSGRRSGRRANFRHGGGYYGGHHHHHHHHGHYHHGGYFVGGMVAGAVVGAAVSSSIDNCTTVYIEGLRYKDCGDGPIRY